jgi:hypothetical protein
MILLCDKSTPVNSSSHLWPPLPTETLHTLVQEVICETTNQHGFNLADHPIRNLVGAEIVRELVKRDRLIGDLASFFVAGLVQNATL